ncbi:MAG: hypothetical protein GX992_09500 [Clostridium sp.]|nr:hypothetical protein [Clostridium sp.]
MGWDIKVDEDTGEVSVKSKDGGSNFAFGSIKASSSSSSAAPTSAPTPAST